MGSNLLSSNKRQKRVKSSTIGSMNLYRRIRWAISVVVHHGLLKIKRLIGIPIMLAYRERGIVKAEVQLQEDNSQKIAIIAAYPANDPMYLHSLENLLKGLTSNFYKVIFVSNRSMPTNVGELLSEYSCGIILRKNIGRDFGAYQAGLFFVEKNFDSEKIDRILLVNDTLIWFNDSSKIVSKSLEDDWNCLYLNLEYKSHAQSFYMSFSKEVLRSKSFKKFWARYIPLNSRIHAIAYGEQGLTTKLLDAGFICKPYVNPSIFAEKVEIGVKEIQILSELEIIDLMRWKGVPSTTPESVKLQRFNYEDQRSGLFDESDHLEVGRELQSMLSTIESYIYSDGPHRVGLHLAILYGIPIKMDMYKCYNISDLRKCLKLCNSEIVDMASDYFLAKSQKYKSGSSKNIKLRNLGEI
jgi:hypothetical protein